MNKIEEAYKIAKERMNELTDPAAIFAFAMGANIMIDYFCEIGEYAKKERTE